MISSTQLQYNIQMSERVDSKSTAYQRNSAAIESLRIANDDRRSLCLTDLSHALVASPVLSNKQQGMLIDALEDSKVLTYREDFASRNEDPDNIDIARWYIEIDAEVQAKALISLATLEDPALSFAIKVDLLTSMFNAGHMVGSRRFNGFGHNPSQAYLNEYEQRVFESKTLLGAELRTAQIIGKMEMELLEDITPDEFRYSPYSDRLRVLRFVHDINTSNDALNRFKTLQEVIYLGCAMALRDEAEIEQKEREIQI